MKFAYLIAFIVLKICSFTAKFIFPEISSHDFHSKFLCKHRDKYSTCDLELQGDYVRDIQNTALLLKGQHISPSDMGTGIYKTRGYSYHCDTW